MKRSGSAWFWYTESSIQKARPHHPESYLKPSRVAGRSAITLLKKKIVPKSKTRELSQVPSRASSASSSSHCFEGTFPQFTDSSLLKSPCFFQKKDPCITLAAQRPRNALLLCRADIHRPACTAGLQHFVRNLLLNGCLSSLLPCHLLWGEVTIR